MRINIYGEELTTDVRIVEKVAETGIRHFGIRIFLESSTFLHHTAADDDRSAVTFWAADEEGKGPNLQKLYEIMQAISNRALDLFSRR